MRATLMLLFSAIFVTMLTVTIQTSMRMPIWEAFATFGDNPWAIATLWDAYLGFLTFYVWVFWREQRLLPRLVWFILIVTLGNMAMSLYVLIQLYRLPGGASPAMILHLREPQP